MSHFDEKEIPTSFEGNQFCFILDVLPTVYNQILTKKTAKYFKSSTTKKTVTCLISQIYLLDRIIRLKILKAKRIKEFFPLLLNKYVTFVISKQMAQDRKLRNAKNLS